MRRIIKLILMWGLIWNFSAPNVITAIQFGAENGQDENELFELEKIKNAFQRKKATINVGGNGFWKSFESWYLHSLYKFSETKSILYYYNGIHSMMSVHYWL